MSEAAAEAGLVADVVPIIDADAIRLTPMNKKQAVDNWEVLAPYLEQVFERSAGRIDAADTLEAIATDMAEVLLIWDPGQFIIYAVIVAEAKIYPQRRVMSLGLCGGAHLPVWAGKIWPVLQDYAREKGFNQIEVTGRRGWKRFIPGAEEIATFYAIDLDTKESE